MLSCARLLRSNSTSQCRLAPGLRSYFRAAYPLTPAQVIDTVLFILIKLTKSSTYRNSYHRMTSFREEHTGI